MNKKTSRIKFLQDKKKSFDKITMLTAYDYPTAKIVDAAGIDMILVGDSLANVVLGLDDVKEVSLSDMIHHAKAVRRGVENAFMVVDIPFCACQNIYRGKAIENIKTLIKETNCDAIKLEWFEGVLELIESLVADNIAVVGHVGLTPQRAEELGGYKVQGKICQGAVEIYKQAKQMQGYGCFSIVIECVPTTVAEVITKNLRIPVIGIGAGKYCDGQILVYHDLLGFDFGRLPKFVKKYMESKPLAIKSIENFCKDVKLQKFPTSDQSYSMDQKEDSYFRKSIEKIA